MKTIKDPSFSIRKEASRLELFIRIITGFIYGIILGVISFIVSIAVFIQFFYILFVGKRHERIAKFVANFVSYAMKVNAYLMYVTDERPPFWPEEL